MNRVLFITKNFPPQIGGGLRRIEAVYKLLSKRSDVKLDTVTAVNNQELFSFYVPQRFVKDRNMNKGINFSNSFSRIKLVDKAFLFWLPFVLVFILPKKYDYIFTTTPVFTNVVIGFLYKVLRVGRPKLIIEYRDLFSFNPSYKNSLKKKIIKLFELLILKTADHIIVTTDAMKKIFSSIIDENKISVVRNYIFSEDLNVVAKKEMNVLDNTFYNIAHIGKLNTGRNPLRVLELLNHSIDNKKIALYFIGVNDAEISWITERAKELGIEINRLFFINEVDRLTSLNYMKRFDGLLLLVNNEAKIKDGYGIPGKLYDYIAINNNIFSDIDSFNNLSCEFKMNVKKEFGSFINFEILENQILDEIFNTTIDKIFLKKVNLWKER